MLIHNLCRSITCFSWRLENRDQDVMSNDRSEPCIDCLAHVFPTPHVLPPLECPRSVSYEKAERK